MFMIMKSLSCSMVNVGVSILKKIYTLYFIVFIFILITKIFNIKKYLSIKKL